MRDFSCCYKTCFFMEETFKNSQVNVSKGFHKQGKSKRKIQIFFNFTFRHVMYLHTNKMQIYLYHKVSSILFLNFLQFTLFIQTKQCNKDTNKIFMEGKFLIINIYNILEQKGNTALNNVHN